MICSDYESALIDRLTIRKLARDRLTFRERRLVCRSYHDDTLKEIGQAEGLSSTRVAQIIDRAVTKMQRAAKRPARTEATALQRAETAELEAQIAAALAPPPFDRAAFLDHMRLLIRLRDTPAEEIAETIRKRERAALDSIMRREEQRGLFDPPPPQPPPPPAPQPWQPSYSAFWVAPSPQPTPVEPWFMPERMPTHADLMEIAAYALSYFTAIRDTRNDGLQHIGTHTAEVICKRDADVIAAAMQRVKQDLPRSVRFSAVPLSRPENTLGAMLAGARVAMSVVSVHEGKQVAIYLTYDL